MDGTTSSQLKCLTINGGGDGCDKDHSGNVGGKGNDGYNSDVVVVVAVMVIMENMAW